MRVCQVMIGTGFGGAERSFVDTALALADRGHAVQAVCHRDFVKRDLLESHGSIRVSPVMIRGAWDLFGAREMTRVIGEFGPDILHSHLARGSHLAGPIARRMGVPIVAKLHNYANLKYYRSIDGFIGTTEDQREYLRKNGYEGDRVTVIPNFSRVPPLKTLRAQPAARAMRPPQFITCGRLHTVKGFDILLKALKALHDDGIPAQLIIGGEGPDRAALTQLCRELNLEDDVEFAGWIDDVPRFLDRGDIYVLSSRTESFGISLLESMARGLPIVSTRCRGPAQLLSEDLAWFATPENVSDLARAMAEALAQPAERVRRAAALRDLFIETYSENLVVPRIIEFYQSCGARDSGGIEQDRAWPSHYSDLTPLALAERGNSRLLAQRELVGALRRNGWSSCRDVINATNVDVIRTTNGRDNCRAVLIQGDRPLQAFLKRHTEQVRSKFLAPWRGPAGWNEAEAIGQCQRSGVATMRLLAAGSEQSSNGKVDSFSLTEDIGGESGFHTVLRWRREGVMQRDDVVATRREMIQAAADLARRMHFAGLFHQDFFWQHLFFSRDATGRMNARVIDLQRAVRATSAPVRAYLWVKDLEQLRFSLQRMRFTDADVSAWYQAYFATPKLAFWQQLLTATVRLRGIRRAIRFALKPIAPSVDATPVPATTPQRRAA